jgi:hypothetical protein
MMLLFCAVVGILLAASCFGYYALLQREVSLQLDRQLQGAAAPVLRDVISEPNSQDINEFNLVDEYFELIDSSGRILQRSRNLDERMKQLEIDFRSSSKTVCQTIRQHDGVTMRGCSIPFQRNAQTFFLPVSTPTREAEQALSNFSRVTFVLLPVSLFGRCEAGRLPRPLRWPVCSQRLFRHGTLAEASSPSLISQHTLFR